MWNINHLLSYQIGLLLLNKVMESNPEPFKPHYCQLLQLFSTVLQDHNNPTALYYCVLTLTAITAYTGSEEMVSQHFSFPFDIWLFQIVYRYLNHYRWDRITFVDVLPF